MICLLCQHDIISVPSYATVIYHRAKVRYHIEDISAVASETDIIEKPLFCRVDKREAFHGGRGWIRTTEVVDNRFTVCPLWPLGNSSMSDINFIAKMELVDGLEPPTC